MREVRMTFGEHLEELRSRIIMALVWLAISTTICFSFGDRVMEWAQRPNSVAIKAGFNVHHYAVLDKSTAEFREIMASSGAWESVFPGLAEEAEQTLRTSALRSEIQEPLEQFIDGFPQLTPDQREQLKRSLMEIFRRAMLTVSPRHGLVVGIAPESGYRGRSSQIVANIERVRGKYEPTRLQKLLGLGRDFDNVSRIVTDFARFLSERHDELAKSYQGFKTLPELEKHLTHLTTDTTLSAARESTRKRIYEVFESIEESIDDLLSDESEQLKLNEFTEGFMNYFKVCLIFGIFLALPLILWEMWKFVGAGLHSNEQRYVLLFTPFSMVLFALGVLFGYFWMIPFVLEFLSTWGAEFAEPDFTMASYINILFTLTILLGLVFQTPLVMIFLNQIDLVRADGFAKARKYTLLGAVVFSTMVTPPDPVSWSMMAGPIMLLYELGIRICRTLERRRERREANAQ